MRMDFFKSSFLLFFQLLIMQILVLNRIKTSAKSMKRQSTLLVLREMQLKTSVRYHHAPVSMAEIEKASYVTCWEDAEQLGEG